LQKKKYAGPFLYTTDDYVEFLKIPAHLKIAVMINAKEFIEQNIKISDIFKKNSPVSIIRIACNYKEISQTKIIATELMSLGFDVYLNIMQANHISNSDLEIAVKNIHSWNCVKVLYLADSFGDMTPQSVREKFGTIQKFWSNPLGFHAHDNKGLALINTLEAHACGVSYLDCTVLGMGRGAGNTRSEELLFELASLGHTQYKADELFELVQTEFREMQKQFEWGKNIEYYLAGSYGIHPTYVQEILAKGKIQGKQFISVINSIKNSSESMLYSEKNLVACIQSSQQANLQQESSLQKNLNEKILIQTNSTADKNCKQKLNDLVLQNNQKILLLGRGATIENYHVHINLFQKRFKTCTLATSARQNFFNLKIDGIFASHYTKVLAENLLSDFSILPTILPLNIFPQSFIDKNLGNLVFNYPLFVDNETFIVTKENCTLPSINSLAFGLAIAAQKGFKEIYLAGFDGFPENANKHLEIQNIFDIFQKYFPKIEIKSITPSKYNIQQISPYSEMKERKNADNYYSSAS
jgi:4-hydroxy 2-oxovalerate aldolase